MTTMGATRVRLTSWLLVALVAAGVAVAVLAARAAHAQEAVEPPPRLVILARSDNPADALASGPIGGVLGAPVLLTPSASLHTAAAEALRQIDPDLVVLTGGQAALSTEVERAVNELGYATRRAAGRDRHETAVLVSALLAEFNTGRPVLTGAPVTDQVIPGLNADRLQGQTPEELVADLRTRLDALEAANARLTALLAGVTRSDIDGRDTLRFAGMNLQVVNGTGSTDGNPNGVGNLIIGYNAQRRSPATRVGSHYLVVGDQHEWTRFGGILAGISNTAHGSWASVSGGFANTASGNAASVSGGSNNTASNLAASVSGGFANTASGIQASVSGGSINTASGSGSSILGGHNRTVTGTNHCHPAC